MCFALIKKLAVDWTFKLISKFMQSKQNVLSDFYYKLVAYIEIRLSVLACSLQHAVGYQRRHVLDNNPPVEKHTKVSQAQTGDPGMAVNWVGHTDLELSPQGEE